MNLEPNDLLLFARVVDEGSFSRAAERLGLPKSTVSRRVAALETQLGERLLLRTTRKLRVTDFGLAMLEHAHHVVEDVAAAASLAQNRQVEPSGRGELAQVLPDWDLPPVSAWAVFPGRRLMPARTRVFVDALVAKFTGPGCQAIEADVAETKTRSRTPRPLR